MHPGQEVVCIDVKGLGHLLTYGKTYTIKATRQDICSCEGLQGFLVDVGIPNPTNGVCCSLCGTSAVINDGIAWVCNTHFTPIDSISIAEAYEVLAKQPYSL